MAYSDHPDGFRNQLGRFFVVNCRPPASPAPVAGPANRGRIVWHGPNCAH